MKRIVTSIVFVSFLSLSALASVGPHADDFEVGLDPVNNRITVEFDADLFPFLLPASEFPLLSGFALDDPGFVSLEPDEAVPGEFEPLPAGTNIVFKLLSTSSPALKVWDPAGPGEPGFQIIGDAMWNLGPVPFDTHPVWHIDNLDPSYDPSAGPWSATFQLLNLTPGLVPGVGASEPITVTFVPEPATVALLALGALLRRTR